MRQVIIGIIVVIVILALIGTLFIFIPRFFQRNRVTIVSPRPTATTFIASPLPGSSPTLLPTTPGNQLYSGPGFTLSYPTGWGILTCSNSSNFEFDPLNNVDQTGVVCDVAQKPITVTVENDLAQCSGERVLIGNVTAIKNTFNKPRFTEMQWCTLTSPILRITHRFSSTPARAVTPTSYVQQVETMIATLQAPALTISPIPTPTIR